MTVSVLTEHGSAHASFPHPFVRAEFAALTAGLQQLLFNFGAVKNQVSGPVAIVAAGAEVARVDFAGLYQFAAIVSINLAVVNALPLPALDGGYMLLLVHTRARMLPSDPAPNRLTCSLIVFWMRAMSLPAIN